MGAKRLLHVHGNSRRVGLISFAVFPVGRPPSPVTWYTARGLPFPLLSFNVSASLISLLRWALFFDGAFLCSNCRHRPLFSPSPSPFLLFTPVWWKHVLHTRVSLEHPCRVLPDTPRLFSAPHPSRPTAAVWHPTLVHLTTSRHSPAADRAFLPPPALMRSLRLPCVHMQASTSHQVGGVHHRCCASPVVGMPRSPQYSHSAAGRRTV